jgi:hypothetical protein
MTAWAHQDTPKQLKAQLKHPQQSSTATERKRRQIPRIREIPGAAAAAAVDVEAAGARDSTRRCEPASPRQAS